MLTAIARGCGTTDLICSGSLLIRADGRLYLPIASAAGILYTTIPSLALFAMLVPVHGLSMLAGRDRAGLPPC
ncbi:MAG: hypothetical protein U0556_11890 [Dehalococcoidia bacterium]